MIYLRKSRKDNEAEARGEGETLARHEKALLELAERLNLNVTDIYREIVSGETISARPVMKRLLGEVSQGVWAGVLCAEVERLARGDTSDQGQVAKTFKFSGAKIITPMKTYDPNDEYDEEYFEFALFMSRREYKIITRRMQRGRMDSVKEGKYAGSRPPLGYRRIKLEKEKGWTLEIVPEEANIIRMIYELYTEGESQKDGSRKRLGVSLIAKKLNRLKIPSKTGKTWVASSVRDILINPVYAGKIRWNWRPAKKKMVDGQVEIERPRAKTEECIIVDGLHEAIVKFDIFTKAQEFMKQNPARPVGERHTVKNPLAGIIICGKCKRAMTRRPYSGKYPDTLMCAVPECPTVSVQLHYVESRILEGLEEWLGEYRLQWGLSKQVTGQKPKNNFAVGLRQEALYKIEAEIKLLNTQLSKIHDLLEQGVYDADTFLNRAREIGGRIGQAQNEHAAVAADIAAEKMRESHISVIPKVERLLDVYRELETPKAKNDLLRDVLEKIIYIKDKGGRWHNAPDDFELTLYPKLPYRAKTN